MEKKEKPIRRFEGTEKINANRYPIDKTRIIRLLSHDELKNQKRGVVLFSVGGKEVVVGKDNIDFETGVFGRSKYGTLI